MQPESTMFEKFNLTTKEFLESLYTSTPAPISPEMNVKMILQKLAAGFLVVVNRQLNDFLPLFVLYSIYLIRPVIVTCLSSHLTAV